MKYIFFCPSYTVGGVQTLFIRLANAFSNFHNVAFVDYRSGFSSGRLSPNVDHVEYVDSDRTKINENSILIIQANYATLPLDDIFDFSKNTKVFFWQLHPRNPYVSLPYSSKLNLNSFIVRILFRKQLKMIRQVTEFAVKKDGYYAMDSSNVNSINIVCPSLKVNMLPLYLGELNSLNSDDSNKRNFVGRRVKVTWIGRLEKGFKTNILERVLSDASEIKEELSIQIVGTGEGEIQIRNHSKACGLEVHYHGAVEENELKEIVKQSDVVFAMGTSAIISSLESVPTICLDFSYSKVAPSYLYRWLYESEGLSLGSLFNGDDFPSENKHSFIEVIESVRGNSFEISKFCYNYVKENYFLPSSHYSNLISKTKVNSSDLLKLQKDNAKSMVIEKIRYKAFKFYDKLRQKKI